ncbi:hypothetical protein PVAND_016478 [Polypedilum vanderplanki]|uniref:Uncharacterized protein n=1 Tax=Polypedilum vanderplanki TaxID=319348 RepID=A0A9J6BF88_POLVA|nr:hypothetical protein PVAND_016478 [Polypedilum vanderplanki]
MRTFIIFLLFSSVFCHNRITKFECNSSNKTITRLKCWVKAFDRRNPVGNIDGELVRKIPNANMYFHRFHKISKDQDYRSNLLLEKIEFCKIMDGASASPFLMSFIDSLRSINYRMATFCSTIGPILLRNISFASDQFTLFTPVGYYLMNVRVFDEIDDNIMSYELFHKLSTDNPYKRSLHVENLEYCKILKGTSFSPFLDKVFSWFNYLHKDFSLACNSTGLLKFHNISFNSNPMLATFPPGFHLSVYKFYDKKDFNIFNVTIVTKIQCNSSNLTISQYKCWTRAYDRRNPVANVEYNLNRNISNGLITFELYHSLSKDLRYTRTLFVENIEFCKIIKGASATEFLTELVETIRYVNENFVLACNTTGLIKFHNMTLNGNSALDIFPPGFYLCIYKFHDKKDSNIFNISMSGVLMGNICIKADSGIENIVKIDLTQNVQILFFGNKEESQAMKDLRNAELERSSRSLQISIFQDQESFCDSQYEAYERLQDPAKN